MTGKNGRAGMGNGSSAGRELPVGSGLLIAFTLGMAGWWGIAQAVIWVAAQ